MGVVVISVVAALVVAVVIAGIVVVGLHGGLPEVSEKAPEIAGRFEWAARHLNGEAEPSPRAAEPGGPVTRTRPGEAGHPSEQSRRQEGPNSTGLPSTGDFGA
ncbi:hypothetical protein [Raineyella fluvialis]|uniref:Uncharacterized protein n=1 Tax=Raineyella fluvialis TaxID=2662261 RepID=A0A5Q2FEU7_9ACTN|nr:hypothetical protein [Raineyella fluvialis]QGF24911.1 hypothetical protein Rai3103_16250 [Raineyella fluvialis]